jgi:hypothetical protein
MKRSVEGRKVAKKGDQDEEKRAKNGGVFLWTKEW